MVQTAIRLKEIIQPQPPPTHHRIEFYCFCQTKIFLRRYTEIHRHLLSKCFRNTVVGCQGMVLHHFWKCFFQHQTETCLLENLWSEKDFWLCCGSKLFSMSLKFIKSMRFFEWNCIVKWVIFFASFCWFWDVLLENLKLKKKLR